MAITTTTTIDDAVKKFLAESRYTLQERPGVVKSSIRVETLPEHEGPSIKIPKFNTVTTYALSEGIDMSQVQTISDTVMTLTPTEFGAQVMLTDLMLLESRDEFFRVAGRVLAESYDRQQDQTLCDDLDNFSTALGSAGTALVVGHIMAAHSAIKYGSPAAGAVRGGEPGPDPVSGIFTPAQLHSLKKSMAGQVGGAVVLATGGTATQTGSPKLDQGAFSEMALWFLDYANKPRFLTGKAGALTYGLTPYWNFRVQFMRQGANLLGSGLRGMANGMQAAGSLASGAGFRLPAGYKKETLVDDLAKGAALATVLTMAHMLLGLFDDDDEMLSKTGAGRLPKEVDTSGKVKLFDRITPEKGTLGYWMLVAPIPYLGEVAMMEALWEGRIEAHDWVANMLSPGDLAQMAAMMWGYANEWDKFKPKGAVAGEIVGNMMFPLPVFRLIRQLFDANKRQAYDYGAGFTENFLLAVRDKLPLTSVDLRKRESVVEGEDYQTYDPWAAAMRFFAMNIQEISEADRAAVINEAYKSRYESLSNRIERAWADPQLAEAQVERQPIPKELRLDEFLQASHTSLPPGTANELVRLGADREQLLAEWRRFAAGKGQAIYESEVKDMVRMGQAQEAWMMRKNGWTDAQIARAMSPGSFRSGGRNRVEAIKRAGAMADKGAPGKRIELRREEAAKERLAAIYKEYQMLRLVGNRAMAGKFLADEMEMPLAQAERALLEALGKTKKDLAAEEFRARTRQSLNPWR